MNTKLNLTKKTNKNKYTKVDVTSYFVGRMGYHVSVSYHRCLFHLLN